MYTDLKNKRAVITGASKETGIGYAIARALAQNGVHTLITDIPGQDTGKEGEAAARKLAADFGVETSFVEMDVTDSDSVRGMAARVQEFWGELDILVNNAGAVFGVPSAVHTYDDDAWERTIAVNLTGAFKVSKSLVPLMLKNRGSIVNIASQAGKKPPLFNGAYAVSKAGLIMMTKVMAKELGTVPIRVNAVCPGIIETDFTKWRFELEARFLNSTPEERKKAKCEEITLRRIGSPEEVARVVVFLCSDASSYMTGQALNITGGQLMEA